MLKSAWFVQVGYYVPDTHQWLLWKTRESPKVEE